MYGNLVPNKFFKMKCIFNIVIFHLFIFIGPNRRFNAHEPNSVVTRPRLSCCSPLYFRLTTYPHTTTQTLNQNNNQSQTTYPPQRALHLNQTATTTWRGNWKAVWICKQLPSIKWRKDCFCWWIWSKLLNASILWKKFGWNNTKKASKIN
jgi:hypothetical protein